MSLLALHAGEFGGAVVARVAAHDPAATTLSLHAPVDELEEAIVAADYVAAAVWRPCIEQCRWLDNACHRHVRRWSLVQVVETTLACGPLVVPRAGVGCYHCYLARTDAHRREGDRRRVLRQAYTRDLALGPRGHTPAMVAIAAATLLHDRALQKPGRFRHVDVLNGSVMESELIPLHDCPRCRPQPAQYQPLRRHVDAIAIELDRVIP